MAMEKYQKLGKYLEKAAAEKSKEKKLGVRVVRACDLEDIQFIPTGIEPFDAVVGGFPRGMYSLIYGGEGVGKTTLELIATGNIINNGMSAMIMEPEHRADKKWWGKHLPLDKVYVSQSSGLGACLDSLIKIAESGTCDIIFVDSLAALAVKELRGKGTEGDHMALVARRLPQFFQIATEIIADTKTSVVFIHQKRDVLDMYATELETYPGGNALRHHVSLVLNMRRASTGRDPDKGERFVGPDRTKLGFMSNIKCIKGTVGTISEGQSIQLDFIHKQGIAVPQSVAMYAIRNKVIEKAGPGNYIFSDNKGKYEQRGLNNVIADITSTDAIRGRILEKCRQYAWENIMDKIEIEPDIEFEAAQIGAPVDKDTKEAATKIAKQDPEEDKNGAVKDTKAVQKK